MEPACAARPKATPGQPATHHRVHADIIDTNGTFTPRTRGRSTTSAPADPRPDPIHPARPGPPHPHYQRRHRRTPAPAHPQPRSRLPAHRPPAPTRTPQNTTPNPDVGSGCPQFPASPSRRDGGIRTRGLLLPTQLNPAARSRPASPDVPPLTCSNVSWRLPDVARRLCLLAPTLAPTLCLGRSPPGGLQRDQLTRPGTGLEH